MVSACRLTIKRHGLKGKRGEWGEKRKESKSRHSFLKIYNPSGIGCPGQMSLPAFKHALPVALHEHKGQRVWVMVLWLWDALPAEIF